MNRKSFRYRGMSLPAPFVRSGDYYYLTLFRLSSTRERPGIRVRKTFVIRQSLIPLNVRSGEALPATNTAGITTHRILIFDDHPDSLRLVFGRAAGPKVDRSTPPVKKWWEPLLGGMLITVALILIFLPLFLKLPS
jgi:hypothetical protein